jgi:DNA polymerase I
MTNAAYGFTAMVLKVLNEHRPDYAIAAFDPPGPTFRHEEFKDYKAQRPSTPPELARQMPWCREITEAMNIPIIEVPGFEADDVIGTLARRGEAEGLDVLILTGDLDALQLVTPHVRVYATRRGITDTVVYDMDRVRERYGFEPPMVVDFKALRGDTSDNIPGVPGIGDKTAMALVQEYGPLESILDAVPAMKEGRVKRALAEHVEQARLSKRMATIIVDLDVPFDLEAARYRSYDRERVLALFERLEFRSLLPRLPMQPGEAAAAGNGAHFVSSGAAPAQLPAPGQGQLSFDTPPPAAAGVEVIRDVDVVRDVVEHLRAAEGGIAVRTVVDEPARHGIIAGVALAALDDPLHAWYLPVGHQVLDGSAPQESVDVVGALMADASVRKTGYDLKREVLAWRRGGVAVQGLDFDLMLAAYLLNQRTRVPALPQLAADLTGATCDSEDVLLGSGRSARRPTDLMVEEASACYGAMIALAGPVRRALERDMDVIGVRTLHDDMELPVAAVLAEMELLGITVDADAMDALRSELERRIGEIESEVYDAAGYTFNLASTQQLAKFLYDDLGLAAGRKTKTGRSTDADSLETLRAENPMVELILEHRQLTKLKGTYVDALPQLVEHDGRVHTSFNQAVATTGRLSSADPNLQNIPIRSEIGQRIRATFVPGDRSHLLVSADYSQIELRVLAHVTQDPGLLDAFRRHEDIHTATASIVYGVPLEAVSRDMRRNAKVVNFGLVYGLSEFGLARDTGMSREDAAAFIQTYFTRFASVTHWLEQTRNHAREWGFVQTFFGRRRYIPDIRAANRGIRQAAERMAVNMPIQGAAADIMKLAMVRADRMLRERTMQARLLLQVHDELVLEAPRSEVDDLAALLCDAMGGAAEISVPLDVDVKVGQNWSEMTPLAVAASAPAGE